MLPPKIIRSSRYRFNPGAGTTGRYIAPSGRFVPQSAITKEMERVIGGAKGEMQSFSRQLQAGSISLQEWYDGMRSNMKIIHNLDAAIAKGGWAQMTQSDWGAVGQLTRQQYQFLNNFALQIANGTQSLDGRFIVRSGMYADAARGTGEDMKRRDAGNRGFTEERRVLGVADHCTDCLEFSARGWQPIGTLPRIGDSLCKTNCHCHFEFR